MSKAQVVVVKKKGHGRHGHHGGAWKVAYADFVTAMMAFFLVMWIVGQAQTVKKGVAGYFRDPGVLEHERSTGILPGSTTGIAESGQTPSVAKEKANKQGDIDRASLERSAQRIRDSLSKLPGFEKVKKQIEIQATPDGMRIELIDSKEGTFFDNASAMLKPETERILSIIGREITTLDRPVAIEGHTDSRPYNKSDGYTNWELSADRANAARRQMERTGLKSSLVLAVRGLADRQLANGADPLDARNRRVSILVVAHVSDAGPQPAAPSARAGDIAPSAPNPPSAGADKPRH